MKYILFIWQILQNIVGLFYWLISQAKYQQTIDNVYVFETDSKQGSVCLGSFVFVTKHAKKKEYTLKHELGHAKQSQYLGPLYLIAVGLPSVLWVFLRRQIPYFRKKDYYSVYPENWANKLGGLD